MRRPSSEHYRELEDDIWEGISPDDRAALIDPVVNVMAEATKRLETSASVISDMAANLAGANAEVSKVAKESAAALKSAVDQVSGAELKSAIDKVSKENGKMQTTLTGVLSEMVTMCETMKRMDETMKRLEAAQTAPKMLVFDTNGRAIGVRSV